MRKIDFFYPSFTKKALTFTIDDGNMKYDKMLLDILKPVGIRGTFNLCSDLHRGKESMTREFYRGYGIANHCKYHPLVNLDGVQYIISDDPFDEQTADKDMIYRVNGKESFYWTTMPNGWRQMVFLEDYIRFVDEGLCELDAIFGEGAVRDFVWPFGERKNAELREYVQKAYRSVRKTGCTKDLDGFAIPKNKKAWSYNADHTNIVEIMEMYEAYPDDGELKFFAFGVHSIDFERYGKWEDLRIFADRYGNRPDTYWYATVEEIFDYEEATARLHVSDTSIENRSGLTLYVAYDGKRYVIAPNQAVSL